MSDSTSTLFDRDPVERITFHYPTLDRTVDLTKSLAIVPKELETAQKLYRRFEQNEAFLVSLFTNPDVDEHELEEERAFIHLVKQFVANIRSRGYAIGVRGVKA